MKKKVAIFGSTGSIGTQALEVIKSQSEFFEISFLVAKKNVTILEKQIEEFHCGGLLIENQPETTKKKINDIINFSNIIIIAIPSEEAVYPTIQALKMGKKVLLASKEALIAEGEKIMAIKSGQLLPIDSELVALWQCLNGKNIKDVEKIILTASGGPFFGKKKKDLEHVSLKEVLNHPTWKNMGKEITVNSATLMNKGFEVIEAHHFFGIPYEKIEVLIHPQSLVHGIVIFKDGNTIMHVAKNDMKLFISWALNYPKVQKNIFEKINLVGKKLDFFEADHETFPALKLAYKAGQKGDKATKKLLRKNKENVRKFLEGKKKFVEILN
ncbi:hypothetical protein A2335_02320 [Candidatus Peregrinibacteria bacterium RIFOXYB2_FULL_32_7]|nr:MAG: hypothetical protein A2335_02320 [Candidatus Peregrinibacteria bacterium RIFOXYB2_FULL_32_7]